MRNVWEVECDLVAVTGTTLQARNACRFEARSLFFSDDNSFGGRCILPKELRTALIDWNVKQTSSLSFAIQITVTVADGKDLLPLFADALFSIRFGGVETVHRDSLNKIYKTQNMRHALHEVLLHAGTGRYLKAFFRGMRPIWQTDRRLTKWIFTQLSRYSHLRDFVKRSNPQSCVG